MLDFDILRRFMKVASILTVSMSVQSPAVVCSADTHRDQRITRDLVNLRLDSIKKEAGQAWIVARITPAATSGGYEGLTKDPATGWLAALPGSRVTKVHEGSLEVMTTLTDSPGDTIRNYKLEQPAFLYEGLVGWGGGPTNVYLPFLKPGIAICRINTEREGISGYNPLFLLPDEWEKYVEPALKVDAELLAEATVANNVAQLGELINHENPLLAIAAWRTLAATGKLDAALVEVALARSTGYKQAALMCLLLKYGYKQAMDVEVVPVDRVIAAAQKPQELEGIALGALVSQADARSGRRYQPKWVATTDRVLLAAYQKYRTFKDRGLGDASLDQIFKTAHLGISLTSGHKTAGQP